MSGLPVEPLPEGSAAACCSSLGMLRVRITKEFRRLFIPAKVRTKGAERGLVSCGLKTFLSSGPAGS